MKLRSFISRGFAVCMLIASSFVARAAFASDNPSAREDRISLHGDWQMQSSCVDKSTADAISTPGYAAKDWHNVPVPGTVVGALVTDHTLPDPTFGMNLKKFPGIVLGGEAPFSNVDMPADSPFRCSYWFRTEFATPANRNEKLAWLHFLGINYRANIWLNGKKIADANDVAGAYRSYEFRVNNLLRPDGKNALAVEVFAPGQDDLGLTWVDWNPTPPDKDMGIWREVFLTESGDVTLRAPFVQSKLDPQYQNADLTLTADVRNSSDHSVQAVVHADLEHVHLEQTIQLAPNESKPVRFAPDQFPQLKLAHPRLWWPYTLGEPTLYSAKFRVEVDHKVSDAATLAFGIREVTSELTDKNHRVFKINGKRILIRGAAWAPDLLLRWDSRRVDADLAYVRHMGLNTIRLEGKTDRDEFFEKTDRLGILVMPGWICCDMWEHWDRWTPETKKIAAASMTDQATRLRNHPSVFVWLYGSDNPPPAEIENMYLGILKDLNWPNPTVSSASETPTTVTGKSGVKMTGPYEYVAPMYWLADTEAGGAYGYNTETSPGPAIPTKESLAKFIPKEHLWPIDDYWNFHAGGERFTTVNVFTDALNKRYGAATSLDDYERKAQAMAYENERAMFEAYGRNKYVSTGVIQWMLNNAWPSLIWHLYDYYLVPGGGYFGTKKALEPVHVQYSYDDQSICVVNSTYLQFSGLKVAAKLYNVDGKEVASQDASTDLAPDAVVRALTLNRPADLSTAYFLKLQLHDATGKLLSDNFYWLSTKADTMDWANRKDTAYTPQKEFGDLTALNSLSTVSLAARARAHRDDRRGTILVTLKNPSTAVAFQVRLRLTKGKGGDDLVPIFWDDNYFSLLPGEERTVGVSYATPDLGETLPFLEISGFNVTPLSLNLAQ